MADYTVSLPARLDDELQRLVRKANQIGLPGQENITPQQFVTLWVVTRLEGHARETEDQRWDSRRRGYAEATVTVQGQVDTLLGVGDGQLQQLQLRRGRRQPR